MDAVRCKQCGETRWSLFSGSIGHLLAEPCRICGGETVVERRRPGGKALTPFTERRDADLAGSRRAARRGS